MPNRLINETSPYLLQHAENPVDWYPWGERALGRARAEDRPTILTETTTNYMQGDSSLFPIFARTVIATAAWQSRCRREISQAARLPRRFDPRDDQRSTHLSRPAVAGNRMHLVELLRQARHVLAGGILVLQLQNKGG